MKKILLASIVFLFAGLVPHVFAQSNFVPLAPIPGLTENALSVANSDSLASFFNNLYKFLIGIAATLAVIEIIWGGIEISTKDSVSQKQDGKARIYNAIFGLVLVLSPVLVFTLINPAILNLSINLPKIDTTITAQCPDGQTGVPPNCARVCSSQQAVAGCVQPAPAHEGFNSEPPAGYSCFQIPPTPLGECGTNSTGGPLDCNYVCATGTNGKSRCNDLYRLNCNGGQPAIPACPSSFSTMPDVCTQY